MSAFGWTGPPVGVMRPGLLAVSGARSPRGMDATPENLALFERILADVRQYVRSSGMRVVHGGAEGVDAAADLPGAEVWLPDYAMYGRSAPKIRNAYATTYATTTALFTAWPAPWSRGTWDAIAQRRAACGDVGLMVRMEREYRACAGWVRI